MKKEEKTPDFLDYVANTHNFQRQATELLNAKKYDELLELCDKTINQPFGNTGDAWMFKGAVLRKKKQLKEAFECLDKALKNSLLNWQALEEMAYLSLDLNNIPQAIRAFEGTINWQLTRLGTIHPHLFYNVGFSYERLANFEKAIEYYDNYLMAEPMNAKVWLHKAFCQKYIGKVEDALQSFKRVLALDPNSKIALEEINLLTKDLDHKDLAIIKNQILLSQGGGRTIAISKTEKIDLPPDKMSEYKKAKTELMMNQAFTMHELGGGMIQTRPAIASVDKEIEQSNIVLSLVPYDLEVILKKGRALLEMKRFEETVKHFDDSLELGSKLSSYFRTSDEYCKNTAQDTLYKDLGFVWLLRARALEELGKFDEALISYKKAKEYSDKLLAKVEPPETTIKPTTAQSPQKPLNFCQTCGKKLSRKVQERIRSKGSGFCPYCRNKIIVK